MKPAINQWAFPWEMSTIDVISKVKEIGFEAFEPCVAPISVDATEADMTAVRRHADNIGIELTSIGVSFGWDLPLSSSDPVMRQKGKDAFTKTLQMASWLGVETVLMVPGGCSEEMRYDVALENATTAVRELVPVAEKFKVSLAIENVWNKFLLSPVEMRDFIDQFDSEYIGAYMDVGNIIPYGFPEQWIQILGSRIRRVHAKDFRAKVGNWDGFVMLMEGDVNWPAVMSALREIGYNGPLTAEYGAYKHSLDVTLKHVLTSLKTIIAL